LQYTEISIIQQAIKFATNERKINNYILFVPFEMSDYLKVAQVPE